MKKRDIAVLVACSCLVALVVLTGVAVALGTPSSASATARATPSGLPSPLQATPSPVPTITPQPSPIAGPLRITGNPRALPGYLLISDRGNSRVIELDPRGNIVWQFPPSGYRGPIPFNQNDDGFFSPDYQKVTTNEEFEHTIQVIDVKTRRVTFYYGTPFHPGSAPNFLNGPDDAYLLPDGLVMTADIKNCRVLFIAPNKTTSQLGHTGACHHDPAHGSWVDVFTLPGLRFEYSFRSPAQYPSDAIIASGRDLSDDRLHCARRRLPCQSVRPCPLEVQQRP